MMQRQSINALGKSALKIDGLRETMLVAGSKIILVHRTSTLCFCLPCSSLLGVKARFEMGFISTKNEKG